MTVLNASSVVYLGQILANYWYIALHLFQVLYENLSYCGRLRKAWWVKHHLSKRPERLRLMIELFLTVRLRVPNFREFAFRGFFSVTKFVLKRDKSNQKEKRPADGAVTNNWMQIYYLCLLRNDQPLKKSQFNLSTLHTIGGFFGSFFCVFCFDAGLWIMMLLNTLNS